MENKHRQRVLIKLGYLGVNPNYFGWISIYNKSKNTYHSFYGNIKNFISNNRFSRKNKCFAFYNKQL